MSEEEAENSAVSLSKDEYEKMLRIISGQNQKIQAMKNLHQLIQSKDNELKSVREKSQNLQTALDRAEARLVNQIRLAAAAKSPACLSTLEADSAMSEKAENRRAALSTRSRVETETDDGRLILATSDIETDGDCAVEQTSRFVVEGLSISSKPLPSLALNDKSKTVLKSSAPFTQHDSTQADNKNAALQSLPLKIASVRSVKIEDTSQSLGGAAKGSLAGTTTLKSFGATGGVSKDLLDKLMHQNARLRKVIKDILEQRGTTIESHLERHEAQDVVAQLREELRLSKQQNEKFRQIINAKDKDDFLKKYTEQNENFQKTKKTVAMLQVMVDTYGKEYEKLQQENKTLRDQLSASAKVNETKTSNEKLVDQGVGCSSSREPPPHKADDEALDRLKASESEREHLQTQCQQLKQMLVRYEKENMKVDQLSKQCAVLESEKQMLESQIAVFQEDFANEHKEYVGKQQHYETMLAKHQDWIRQLVAEGQKSRSSLEEERAKRLMAESSCHSIQEQFRKYIIEYRSSLGLCRSAENSGAAAVTPVYVDLQVDNAPETPSLRHQRSSARNEEVDGMLVCPRCEREFDRQDEQKFREHTARCTDD